MESPPQSKKLMKNKDVSHMNTGAETQQHAENGDLFIQHSKSTDFSQSSRVTGNNSCASPSGTVYTSDREEGALFGSETEKKPTGIRLVVIMISLFLSLLLVSLDQSIVSTALPAIASSFHALDEIEWIGTAYILPMTAFQPLFGKVADVFGRKETLLASITLFLVGSGLAGASTSMIMLCIMRGIQGLGAAGIAPLVVIIINDMVSLRDCAKYQGLLGLCWATGSIAGPLVGGILAENAGWMWIFLINLPIGIAALFILLIFLRSNQCGHQKQHHQRQGQVNDEEFSLWQKIARIDFVGTVLFISSIMCFLLATQWAGTTYPWTSQIIISLYASSFGLLAVSLTVSWRISHDPIMPSWIFKDRTTVALIIMCVAISMAMFINIYYLPIYFQVVNGDTPARAGIEVLPYLLPIDVLSVLVGLLVSKTGHYQFTFWIGTILIVIGGVLQSFLSISSPTMDQVLFLAVTGTGIGCCVQNFYIAAQVIASRRAPKEVATLVSSISFFEYLGFACGIAVGGSVFSNLLGHLLRRDTALPEQDIIRIKKNPAIIRTLPTELHKQVIQAFSGALQWVFVALATCGTVAFVASLCMTPYKISCEEEEEQDANSNTDQQAI
ncbi:major facilitator superfamily domain-containing protein [Syncephalastrum racemosum]|uniref:Major facilitator superfamily domain-containing protein n=1 Tax=Syncephalastrum racemosum TaxID=13706 RepID=A0A1X2HI17_SYNRA|nr:major facilitator superfamily domain-containing protein [Syncephalastrum racemosum]